MAGLKVKVRPISRAMPTPSTDGVNIENMALESNAFSDKKISNEPIPLKKMVVGRVRTRRRKKSVFGRITGALFGEDAKKVMDYILHDVLIPAAKSTITDVVSGGVERWIYGNEDHPSGRLRQDKGRSIVSYSSIYGGRDRQRPSHNASRKRGRTIDELIFESRNEASEVLDSLLAALEEYECVSVADLYDLIGKTSSDFTTQNYGWYSLKDASVDRVRGGYLLNLPETETLS